jgi:hypothetical protein
MSNGYLKGVENIEKQLKDIKLEDVPLYWKTIGLSSYLKENRINDLPYYPGKPDVREKDIPQFFYSVVDKYGASAESRLKFLRKFFLYYYYSEEFREHVKNYYILLLEDQYSGVFESEDKAVQYADEKDIPGKDLLLIPITPIVINR